MPRRSKRKNDFHGGSEHARRSAVGAPTPFPHELNHGEIGKSDPLWGQCTALPVRPFHGGFGGQFMEVWARFMEGLDSWMFWTWGRPKQRPPPNRHTHTRTPGFREPKRLKSFEKNTFMFCILWSVARTMHDLLKGPLRHASNLCGPFLCDRASCCVPEAPLDGPLHRIYMVECSAAWVC